MANTTNRTRRAITMAMLGGLTLGTLGMSGCDNAGEGLFSVLTDGKLDCRSLNKRNTNSTSCRGITKCH